MSLHGGIRRAAGTGDPEVPPPSRRAVWAGWIAALAATAGFLPLHVVWAAGVPLFADEERFDAWYADGGGTYLWALNVLAILPAILAVAMIRPWGLVFPRWVPGLAGRRVPRWLLVVYGIPQFAVWTVALAVATRSYARRTRR